MTRTLQNFIDLTYIHYLLFGHLVSLSTLKSIQFVTLLRYLHRLKKTDSFILIHYLFMWKYVGLDDIEVNTILVDLL